MNKADCYKFLSTSPNKRVSGYDASHLHPNPRFARTSDTRKTLSESPSPLMEGVYND